MANICILVVEDEGIVAIDLQNRLERLGYDVPVVVSSGEQAIQQAADIRPDLILMDIMLEGEMDGVAAAEQIRLHFDIPVIYLTAFSDGSTLHRAKITEPFGYILKPFEIRELHTTIEMALYKHRLEKKLKENERWLAATLKSIGDGVIATDDKGRVTFMNPMAELLTGWQQAEAMDKELAEVFNIIKIESPTRLKSPITHMFQEEGGTDAVNQSALIARDGTKRAIDEITTPISDEHGNVTGAVLAFRDVTERRQAEVEREKLIEELDAFARTVAHDLQTPLARIIGFADLLADDHTAFSVQQLQEYLQIIARNGAKMSTIIDELLLLAGVRKKKVGLKPLDMAAIVAEAQQRLADVIEKHQAKVVLPDTWPTALGHAPWVEEVWANYLSNAVKYGGRPPYVELGAAAQADGMVRFWIQDNGPGLSPDDLTRLFMPFTRLSHTRAEGHGLGLSIVHRIVEKLNGQVGVESDNLPGQGCVFSFTLPVEIGD